MTGTRARLDGLRVLVVDDDADIREAMGLALRCEGATVEEAPDGSVASHLLAAHRPDAMVLDLMLPGQSGFAVLERARAGPSPVPVVMVTANRGQRHAEMARSLGADSYLVKPVPLARLVDAVAAASGR